MAMLIGQKANNRERSHCQRSGRPKGSWQERWKPDDPAVLIRKGVQDSENRIRERIAGVEHCDLAQIGANGAAYSQVKNVQ